MSCPSAPPGGRVVEPRVPSAVLVKRANALRRGLQRTKYRAPDALHRRLDLPLGYAQAADL